MLARPLQLAWILALGAAGCNGGGTSQSSTAGAGGSVPEFDGGPHLTIETPAYSLTPGEDKRYFCYSTRVDQDAMVTGVDPVYGKATHHLGVFATTADEPDGVFDCPELLKDTWMPLYVGGIAGGSLALPTGTAYHFAKGAQILVQVHLVNVTTSPVSDRVFVFLPTTSDTTSKPAGAFFLSNQSFSIPAHAMSYDAAMDCMVGKDMDVFALLPHMHQLGRHITLSKATMPTYDVLFDSAWSFENEPTVPKSFMLASSDSLHLDCAFVNPGAMPVNYGQQYSDEMCTFFVYYTPFDMFTGCKK